MNEILLKKIFRSVYHLYTQKGLGLGVQLKT